MASPTPSAAAVKLQTIDTMPTTPPSTSPAMAEARDCEGTKTTVPCAPVVIVHGGAWNMPDYMAADYIAGVEAAAISGYKHLIGNRTKSMSDRIAATGGAVASASEALQAVEAAVRCLEDAPVFNAGTGSSLTVQGKVEMDAMIMDGRTLAVGAVSSLTVAKNAVSVARLVLEHSRHGFLTGKGADGFATHMGANLATQNDLKTEQAMIKLLAARNSMSYGKLLEAATDAKRCMTATAATAGGTAQDPAPATDLSSSPGPAAAPTAPTAATSTTRDKAGGVNVEEVPMEAATLQGAGVFVSGANLRTRKVINMPTVAKVLDTAVITPLSHNIRESRRRRRSRSASVGAGRERAAKRAASPRHADRSTQPKKRSRAAGVKQTPPRTRSQTANKGVFPTPDLPMDTVGAVALDANGHLASATSTGGITNKAPGRVGDAPLTGCGAFADDEVAAVSTTGQGEAIMRVCLALNAVNRVRTGRTARAAASQALQYMKTRVGGVGGMIMITKQGEWAASCTTKAMAWACVDSGVLYSGTSNGASTQFVHQRSLAAGGRSQQATAAAKPSTVPGPEQHTLGAAAAADGEDDLLA